MPSFFQKLPCSVSASCSRPRWRCMRSPGIGRFPRRSLRRWRSCVSRRRRCAAPICSKRCGRCPYAIPEAQRETVLAQDVERFNRLPDRMPFQSTAAGYRRLPRWPSTAPARCTASTGGCLQRVREQPQALCRCIGDTGCAVGQDAGIGGLRRLPQSVTATGRYPVARIAADAVVDDGQRPGFRPGAHHPSLVRRLHRCAGWPCADAEQRQSGDHDDWRSDAAWQCATVCRHAGRATGAAVAACALRRSVRTGDDAGDLALSGAAWRIADGVLAAAGRAPSTR